jgi:cyclic di-GMP phosphodiesterase
MILIRTITLSTISGKLARFIGLSQNEEKRIIDAGILHDIGKIATDKGILHKPGVLDGMEYEHIKEHPVAGEKICAPLHFAKPLLQIIRNHHERFDGTGCPDGLRGDEIVIGARIITIADVYDALTTMRPYRRCMPRLI